MNNDGSDYKTIKKDFDILKGIATELISENAELKNEIDEKERELNLLYKVLRDITYSMDWNEIQRKLLDIILDFFAVVQFCMIALYEDTPNIIRIRMKRYDREAQEADMLELPFDVDQTTTWDEIVASDAWNEFFRKLDLGGRMQTSFIPLQLKNRELGFLMIGKPTDVEYGKGEWRFLSTIAGHLAITLENAELYHFATTDQLTGLFNRRYLKYRLERECEHAGRRQSLFCIFMIDIDRFKNVNDTYGHPSGDQVLRELARRMRSFVDDSGIACRYGGEEFLIMLPGIDIRTGAKKAEELREIVAGTPFNFTSDGQSITKEITISAGVCGYPRDGGDVDALINKADQALYLAKAQGRNRVVAHI